MAPTNPYQAPTAPVERHSATHDAAVRPPRRVRAGQGGAWLNAGISAIGQRLSGWILVLMILTLFYIVSALVGTLLGAIHPALNLLSTLLLYPLLTIMWGGIMVACHNGPLTLAKVIDGALANVGPLALLGVLGAVLTMFVVIPLGVIFGLGMAGAIDSPAISLVSMLLVIFAAIVVFALVAAAMWFSPALVAIGKVRPWIAIKRSFAAFFMNFLPFTVFSLFALVLVVAGMLFMMLVMAIVAGVVGFVASVDTMAGGGLPIFMIGGVVGYVLFSFAFVAVTAAAQYASFRDVFAYEVD